MCGKSPWTVLVPDNVYELFDFISKISALSEKRSAHYVIFILASAALFRLDCLTFSSQIQVERFDKQSSDIRASPKRKVWCHDIAAVPESVRENPRHLNYRRSQELDLSATLTWRISRQDLSLHPHFIQPTRELKANDHRQRRVFADRTLEQLEVDPNLAEKSFLVTRIIFRWIDTLMNKIVGFMDDPNPQEIHQH